MSRSEGKRKQKVSECAVELPYGRVFGAAAAKARFGLL